MKRPTQADVAKLAGVSRAVVSYVLNDRTDGRISITPETRRRVLAAIEELGYQPDAAAQSLRLGRTRSIGVLIPDAHNPHYWQIVQGIESEAQAYGYDLFLSSTSLDPDRELAAVRALMRGRIDGLILLLTYRGLLDPELQMLKHTRNPLVFVGGAPRTECCYDAVLTGLSDGATEMLRHLIGLGHRRIGLVYGVAAPELGLDRLEAYRRELAAIGEAVDDSLVVHCTPRLEDGYRAALRLLDRGPRPTAILAINDYLALGVLRACADRGVRVPEDVSVAGFDDIEASPYLVPALTTVRTNAEEIGRSALRLLFARMQQPDRKCQQVYVPAQLAVRGSTGPVPRAQPSEPLRTPTTV
ncbi:MAG: Catabolite control protein A [Chloroflexi bacterium ADurb.Bin325]|nr:MAG: Catabolite control protein A [Chloroflexi bacterium ADurb.Bin325]